jgi:DNA topoisomerase-2
MPGFSYNLPATKCITGAKLVKIPGSVCSGCYALKGKNLNVYDAKMSDVIDNKEIMDILTITGLIFGEKVISTMSLRFGKIVILSDNDLDGSHCCSLLISFFAKFWPELFKLGAIYRMVTPLYMVKESRGSKEHEFFTVEEYEEWNRKGIKHTSKYFKGLGTFKTESFEKFLANIDKYLIKINPLDDEDIKKLALAFSEGQEDNRKVWLEDFSYFNKGD